ncbi:hypothetical protein Tco_0907867 [Tanacetum coccineum]|uniref:Uncharacterized protein n=1 Tax=Tanacetum coccineum TaxID=301880 RepID=A0ABQ5CLY1_9ASTR
MDERLPEDIFAGSVALSSQYGTPRCDGLHKLQEIHVIVKPGYGIEFAYVILSYGIVLKLDDLSPVLKQGDSESKINLTRTSQNVSAEETNSGSGLKLKGSKQSHIKVHFKGIIAKVQCQRFNAKGSNIKGQNMVNRVAFEGVCFATFFATALLCDNCSELECYWPLSKIDGFATRVRSPASENDSAFWLHVNNNINYGAIIPKIVKSHDETRGWKNIGRVKWDYLTEDMREDGRREGGEDT